MQGLLVLEGAEGTEFGRRGVGFHAHAHIRGTAALGRCRSLEKTAGAGCGPWGTAARPGTRPSASRLAVALASASAGRRNGWSGRDLGGRSTVGGGTVTNTVSRTICVGTMGGCKVPLPGPLPEASTITTTMTTRATTAAPASSSQLGPWRGAGTGAGPGAGGGTGGGQAVG